MELVLTPSARHCLRVLLALGAYPGGAPAPIRLMVNTRAELLGASLVEEIMLPSGMVGYQLTMRGAAIAQEVG